MCPSDRAHRGLSSLFAGPFVELKSLVCWPPPRAMTFSCGWLRRQQRVRMKQRGGFVPIEVTYPARSLNPLWARSLGRRRHRTASPFPPRSSKREEGQGSSSSLPKAGESLRISLRNGPRFVGVGASERCPCRDEGAGRARNLVRHEAASLLQTDSSLTSHPTARGRHRVWRRPKILRLQFSEGPGEKRARPCMDADRSPPSQQGATPFRGNGERPHSTC